jgi:hypothetical protein
LFPDIRGCDIQHDLLPKNRTSKYAIIAPLSKGTDHEKSRFTEEPIIAILREAETSTVSIESLCRQYDFVFDGCANGEKLKLLTVVDE